MTEYREPRFAELDALIAAEDAASARRVMDRSLDRTAAHARRLYVAPKNNLRFRFGTWHYQFEVRGRLYSGSTRECAREAAKSFADRLKIAIEQSE